jgi:hypothetical protein
VEDHYVLQYVRSPVVKKSSMLLIGNAGSIVSLAPNEGRCKVIKLFSLSSLPHSGRICLRDNASPSLSLSSAACLSKPKGQGAIAKRGKRWRF